MAINIDYFDTSDSSSSEQQECNGRLYARHCVFNLLSDGHPLLSCLKILRDDVNNANWVGNTDANFHFGTGFLSELHFIQKDFEEASIENTIHRTFIQHLERCYKLEVEPSRKDMIL